MTENVENLKRNKPVTSVSMNQKSIDFVHNLAVEAGLTYSAAMEKCIELTRAGMDTNTYDLGPDHYKVISLTSNLGRSGMWVKDQTILQSEILLELRAIKDMMAKLLNKEDKI